jgi:hypothetical protein
MAIQVIVTSLHYMELSVINFSETKIVFMLIYMYVCIYVSVCVCAYIYLYILYLSWFLKLHASRHILR